MILLNRIKELRKLHNLTQEELGMKLGVQKAAVSKWENGDVLNIKTDCVQQMSDLFGVTPTYLMGWDAYEKEAVRVLPTIEKVQAEWGKEAVEAISYMNELNEDGKQKAVELISLITEIPKYQKEGVK